MSGSADPTEDFIASVLEAIGMHIQLSPEQALRIEERLRADYGGERVYIHREGWFDRDQRDARIRAERQAGLSIREIAGRYGLGVATVHEILLRDAA